MKKEFSKQYDSHNQKSKASLVFCLSVSIIVIFVSATMAEDLSQEFDPINLLDNISLNHQPDIDQTSIQVARLTLDKKQTLSSSTIASNLDEETSNKTPYLFLAKGPTTYQTQQLWKARISAPDDTESNKSKTELQRVIEQVNSVEFNSNQKTVEPVIAAEPVQKSQPTETLNDTTPTSKATSKAEHKLASEKITEQTLQIFKNLSQTPEKINNPFQLAEILFNANCLKEASICYQQALKLIDATKHEKNSDKAWILFQIGNCLRKTDMTAAIESYKQLIGEYPDSQWTDIAKAEIDLIKWLMENNPDNMINQCKL